MEIADEIEWGLGRAALQWLPSWYVEEFQALYDSVEVFEPDEKEFHVCTLPAIDVRMTVARYVEEGSTLIFYQHAAMYGEVEEHLFHHAESELADCFRTWGWKLRKNDEPYLALRLMKPARQMFRSKGGAVNWLLVVVRQPLAGLIDETFDVQRRFFGELDNSLAEKIVVRPRTNKGGVAELQIADEVRRKVLSIDNGASRMTSLVADAELVILDMFPSTAFMECLTGGVPVIAIVPEGTSFTTNAAQYYEEFLQIGLLHETPESAASFLNQLSVRSWWERVRELDCVNDYLSVFCNRSAARIGGRYQ